MFIKLHTVSDNAVVYVNIHMVSHFYESSNGGTTLWIKGGTLIYVRESISTVIEYVAEERLLG